MNLNLVLIFLFVAFAFVFRKNDEKSRLKYIITCCTLLILSAALRSLDYGQEGADTMNYYYMFQNIHDNSFSDIWKMAVARYYFGVSEEDIGFMFLQKVIGIFTSDFHLFTFIALLLFFIPFAKLLYRYSNNILELLFAFVFYLALVHSHAMTGARQFYAMGFGIMFFLFYTEKKYKHAAIALFLGMTIHLSLLLVVIPFVLSFLKPSWLKSLHILLFLVFPIVMMMPNTVIAFMGNFIGSEKYAEYGMKEVVGGTETFIFLLEALSFMCLLGIKKIDLANEHKKYLYAMVPCFTFFGPLIFSNGSMIRISMYSYLYLTLLLPFAVEGLFKKSKKEALIGLIIILSLLMTRGGSTYHFFWEVDPITTW